MMSIPRPLRALARVVLRPEARHDARHELRRRLRGEPQLPAPRIQRVLFVCHGNICRSPYGAALLAAQRPGLEVDSAGIAAGEGNPAESLAARVAEARGIPLADHRSHRLTTDDLARADLVLGMEGRHVEAIERAWPGHRAKLRLLGDYLGNPPFRIEDPWGQDQTVFEDTFRRIEMAVERLSVLVDGAGR